MPNLSQDRPEKSDKDQEQYSFQPPILHPIHIFKNESECKKKYEYHQHIRDGCQSTEGNMFQIVFEPFVQWALS